MNDVKERNRVLSAATPLAPQIKNVLNNMSDEIMGKLKEIRLRIGLPVAFNFMGETKFLSRNGCLVNSCANQEMLICSEQMIYDAFKNICGHSVYSHMQEITSGYITMPFGHRAGICGTAVISDGKIINIRDVSSISIRISRQIKGIASDIASKFSKSFGGLLLCGVPSSGKTTLLRDMTRLLSTEYSMCVSVVDTRNEISGTYRGKSQNDLGLSDVLVSYPRTMGIEHALRSLSPDVIICDEIGSKEDAQAILSAVNSGVRVIASIHAGTLKELSSRAYASEILGTKAFSAVAFLSSPANPGRISKIVSPEEVKRE